MNVSSAIQAVEAQEARRIAATIARDFDTVEAIVGPDLCYVHSSATVEDHALYMERLRNGHYVYRGIASEERSHRTIGDDVVLVNGRVRIDVEGKGAVKQVNARYLQVWARRPSGWQLVSWQSTPIPA